MSVGGETAGLRSPSAASAQTLDVSHLDAACLGSVRLAVFRDYPRNMSRGGGGGKTEVMGLRRSGSVSDGVCPPGGAVAHVT